MVFADADLDRAVPFLVNAGIQNAGQTCSASSRILVERSVYEDVIARMSERYRALKVGPAESDLSVGPVVSQRQKAIVEDFLGVARQDGLEVAAHGLHRLDVVDLGHFPSSRGGGTAAADVVVASGVTAVLAHNDLVALALMDRLRSRGVRIPEEISVVGHDDTVAVLGSPRLTTIAVPLARLGRAAVDRLLDDEPGPDTPLPVELVVRASTAPPRSS